MRTDQWVGGKLNSVQLNVEHVVKNPNFAAMMRNSEQHKSKFLACRYVFEQRRAQSSLTVKKAN